MFKFICSALHILKISRTGGQADFVYKHLTQKNFIFLSSTSWYVPPKSTYIHIPSIQTFLLSYLHCLSTLFRLFLLTYLWDPITTSIYFYLGFYTVLYYMSAQQNQNMNGLAELQDYTSRTLYTEQISDIPTCHYHICYTI